MGSGTTHGGASEKAVERAADCVGSSPVKAVYEDAGRIARVALAAAHDPALGLDRSVCLRDVVELLRRNAEISLTKEAEHFNRTLADLIERTFGGGS